MTETKDVQINLSVDAAGLMSEYQKAQAATASLQKQLRATGAAGDEGARGLSSMERMLERQNSTYKEAQRLIAVYEDQLQKTSASETARIGELQRNLGFLNQQMLRIDRSTTQFTQTSSRGAGSMRSYTNAIQQGGYQVGDFAVQIASGQGALRAFTQQATQFVSAFGPWGAVAGAVLAVGGALAMVYTEMQEAEVATKSFDEVMKDVTLSSKEANRELRQLKEGFASVDQMDAFDDIASDIANTERHLESMRWSLDNLEDPLARVAAAWHVWIARGRLDDLINDQARLAAEAEKTALANERLYRAKTVEELQKQADVYRAVAKEANAYGLSIEEIERVTEVSLSSVAKGISLNSANLQIILKETKARDDAKKALDDQVQALKDLQKELDKGPRPVKKPTMIDDPFAETDAQRKQREAKEKQEAKAREAALVAYQRLGRQLDGVSKHTETFIKRQAVLNKAFIKGGVGVDEYLKRLKQIRAIRDEAIRDDTAKETLKINEENATAVAAAESAYKDLRKELGQLDQAQELYNQRIEILHDAYEAKLIKDIHEYRRQVALVRKEMEDAGKDKGFFDGVSAGFKRVAEEGKKFSNEVADWTVSATEQMGDAFVDFALTGKASFKDMANSILSDLARIIARQAIVRPLAESASGFDFGSFFKFSTGGYVSGPGTGTSDSIPARLSDGEFVINAKATAQNRDLLEAINAGKTFAPKIDVPDMAANDMGPAQGGSVIHQEINITSEVGGEPEVRQNGANIDVVIKKVVSDDIGRRGPVYNSIKRSFAVSSQVTKRG